MKIQLQRETTEEAFDVLTGTTPLSKPLKNPDHVQLSMTMFFIQTSTHPRVAIQLHGNSTPNNSPSLVGGKVSRIFPFIFSQRVIIVQDKLLHELHLSHTLNYFHLILKHPHLFLCKPRMNLNCIIRRCFKLKF